VTWLLDIFSWLIGKLFGPKTDPAVTAEALGRSEAQQAVAVDSARVEAAVAQSEANAPRTIDDAVERARSGTL
jgi:hypothetical protein